MIKLVVFLLIFLPNDFKDQSRNIHDSLPAEEVESAPDSWNCGWGKVMFPLAGSPAPPPFPTLKTLLVGFLELQLHRAGAQQAQTSTQKHTQLKVKLKGESCLRKQWWTWSPTSLWKPGCCWLPAWFSFTCEWLSSPPCSGTWGVNLTTVSLAGLDNPKGNWRGRCLKLGSYKTKYSSTQPLIPALKL